MYSSIWNGLCESGTARIGIALPPYRRWKCARVMYVRIHTISRNPHSATRYKGDIRVHIVSICEKSDRAPIYIIAFRYLVCARFISFAADASNGPDQPRTPSRWWFISTLQGTHTCDRARKGPRDYGNGPINSISSGQRADSRGTSGSFARQPGRAYLSPRPRF